MKLIPTILLLAITLSLHAQLTLTKLSCEYMDNPTVVDEKTPHLSWINLAKPCERGQKQTAYQIRVASSTKKLKSILFMISPQGLATRYLLFFYLIIISKLPSQFFETFLSIRSFACSAINLYPLDLG